MHGVSALSLSCETHDWLPGTWCLDWVTRSEHEPSLDLLGSSQSWISDGFDATWGWPGLVFDHAWAVEIQQRLGIANGFTSIGVACRSVDRTEIFRVTQPPSQISGFAPEGHIGLNRACQSHRHIPQGHSVQGWEAIMIDRMAGFGESLIEDGQILELEDADSLCRQRNAHPLNGCWPWYPLALLSVPSIIEEGGADYP